MYSLFRFSRNTQGGSHQLPELSYIRDNIKRQVSDVQRYYRRHQKPVESSNIFVNLLNSLPILNSHDDYTFSRFIEDQADRVANRFRIVSPNFKGKVHEKGILLGPKATEIIISEENSDPFINTEKNWWELAPVKYIYHTRTDLNCPILNNTTKGIAFGVLTVNIPMLAVKYRHWRRYVLERDGNSVPSVSAFVACFVLPDVLPSYMDIAVFNRFDRIAGGVKNMKFPSPHPFYLTDFSTRIDDLAPRVFANANKNNDLKQVLTSTPVIFHKNAFDLFFSSYPLLNYNTEWAYALSLLPIFSYLVKHFMKSQSLDGVGNKLHQSIRQLKLDNTFANIGSSETTKRLILIVDELMSDIESKPKS